VEAAARLAAELAGASELRWFHAPGRVNLIGDHTDYNDGFVLPLAIDRGCTVAAGPAPVVRVRSLDLAGTVELPADGGAEPAAVEPAWGRYAAAVLRELSTRGRPPAGIDAVVASDVPIGSGLSSSAALEVACAIALADAAGWSIPPVELAQACRAAEEAAVGVPCGIMDQLASIGSRAGSALLIDCRSLELTPVGLPDRLGLLVVHSGIARTLDASAYADRRRACEELAARLGLRALRDATHTLVADEPLGRHVVGENERVLAAAQALADGNVDLLGALLLASHASLRDDFRVSTPELDVLVDELVAAGAFGARLTGAGFGGCVVAACDADALDPIAARAGDRYRRRTGLEPTAFACRAVDCARRIDAPVA
jgi:galactokinase